jgi:hypothetical protein
MKEQFLAELKALMEKYDVSINFCVSACSDTHGLSDEKMTIEHRISKDSFKEEVWLEIDGYGIIADDIEVK